LSIIYYLLLHYIGVYKLVFGLLSMNVSKFFMTPSQAKNILPKYVNFYYLQCL